MTKTIYAYYVLRFGIVKKCKLIARNMILCRKIDNIMSTRSVLQAVCYFHNAQSYQKDKLF